MTPYEVAFFAVCCVWIVALVRWYRSETAPAPSRLELVIHGCTFYECDPAFLVTYNEEGGYHEVTGYVIMTQETFARLTEAA